MTIRMMKRGEKITPAYEKDSKAINTQALKMKSGDIVAFEMKEYRNKKHHDKYHAVLDWSIDNSDKIKSKFSTHDNLHYAMKCAYCELNPQMWNRRVLINGAIRQEPFSEAMHEMRQDDFQKYYKFALYLLADIIGCEATDIDANCEEYI